MFKKEKIVAAIIVCSLALSACSGEEGMSVGTKVSSTQISSKDEASSGASTNRKNEKEDARILVSDLRYMNIASTQEGLYRIDYEEIADGNWGYKAYYVDYASAKEIVLCSDTSCRHDSKECMGVFLEESLVNPELFVYKDKVYIYCTQDDSGSVVTSFDSSDDFQFVSYPARLYEMNLDGTNRRLVKEFSQEYTIGETVLSWNGELVFLQKAIKSEKDKDGKIHYITEDCKLISLDTTSGETKELINLPGEYTLDGTYKNSLVCRKTKYADGYTQKEADELEFSQWRELMNRSNEEFVLVDLESGKDESIFEASNKDFSGCIVMNNKLYLDMNSNEVTCIDLETKESSAIEMDDRYEIVESVGDRLFCWRENHCEEMYYWDPATNEIQRADMKIKGTNLNIDIVAYTDESIIAICDGDYKNSGIDKDAYDCNSTIFGIIKKSDLYKGKTKYTPVDMCSKGVC